MKTRRITPLSLLAVLALAACALTVPVTIVRELAYRAPAAGSTEIEIPIDLTQEDAVWSRRDKVKDFTVDQIRTTVTSSQATGAHVALQLRFRPDGAPADGSQDVVVGDVADLLFEIGAEASLPGSAAADALVLDAIKGTGRFTAVARATSDAPVDGTMDLKLSGSLSYEVLGR